MIIYYGGPQKVADMFILSQWFKSISSDTGHRCINMKWVECCECTYHWLFTLADSSAVAKGKCHAPGIFHPTFLFYLLHQELKTFNQKP